MAGLGTTEYPERTALLKQIIDLHAQFYDNFLLALEAPRALLKTQFGDLRAQLSHLSFVPAEAIDMRSSIANAADLCLTALMQLVDKELLLILCACRGRPLPPVAQWTTNSLKDAFQQYEISLDKLPCADHVRVLRIFADSWKRDPLTPSDELVRLLRMTMPYPAQSYGLLSNSAIRTAMAEMIGLTPGDSGETDIVRAYLESARKYLHAAVDAAPVVS